MKYEIQTDKDNNIVSYYPVDNEVSNTFLELENIDDEKMHYSKLVDGKIILDEEKYQEYLRQRELPTQLETIEAQTLYTALMTDTMLEEEVK